MWSQTAHALIEDYDALLSAPLSLIRSSLESTAEFVSRIDHTAAWIGTVGVGKTTALSLLTNLVLPDKQGRPQPIFPASGGRTTISEVVIRVAPAYGISVEPKSEDEVRLLVAELVNSVAKGVGGISTELDRAIRNMAELRKRRNPHDPRAMIDPIRDMLTAKGDSEDDVVDHIVNQMGLDKRTETQMILSETASGGLQWLSDNISAINFGQHARFSVPQRTTVFLPETAIRSSKYSLSIIDTKGIHGTTERSDLHGIINDPRTLTILCSSFNDAPGTDPLRLMNSLKGMGSDVFDKQRMMLLVLPRGDEALKIIDDAGNQPDSLDYGYMIRTSQVEDTLAEAGLPKVPVAFFNAMDGSASDVWAEICRRIDLLRQGQLDRLGRFVAMSKELIANTNAARLQQARVALAAEAEAIARRYRELPTTVRPAHQSLIEQINVGHSSSIAASVLRRGAWENFEINHMMGVDVRVDANLRSSSLFTKIDTRFEALEEKFSSVPEAIGLVQTLREDLGDWRQEFLARSLMIGRNVFKSYMDKSEEFWSELAARYGGGSGYRKDISSMVRS